MAQGHSDKQATKKHEVDFKFAKQLKIENVVNSNVKELNAALSFFKTIQCIFMETSRSVKAI